MRSRRTRTGVYRPKRIPGGRMRRVDLSHFDPHQPRDPDGRWTLTGPEMAALKFWTEGHGGTRRIQKGSAYSGAFESALAKLPKVQGPLYRGVKGKGADRHAELDVGDVVDWSEPKSVSTDVHKAFAFGTNVYEIEGSARSLAGHSKFAYEHEAVLPAGRFRVTGREMRKVYGAPVSVVRLKEISDVGLAVPRDLDLAGFDPHQPRNPATGRWWKTAESLAKDAIEGGFTVRVGDMTTVKHGFVVARPGTTFLPANDVKSAGAQIRRFLDDHPGVENLGGWYNPDDGRVYLDIVDIVKDKDEAVRLGQDRNQIAIFDLDTLTTIDTGGTGEEDPDLSSGELGRDDGGGEDRVGRAGRSGSRRARSLIDLAGFDPDQPRDTAGRWFHGTAAVLKPGDILRPGRVLGKKNFDYESHHADNDAVFITDQISKALGYGRLSKADDSGTYTKAPHVYEVTPVGVLNPDPRDPGSWRAGAARVVREVHPRPNRNARRKEAGLPLLPDEPAPMYDLANPSLDRTRRITSQILNGEDPAQLLRQRGVYGPVADAVVKLAGEGTAHRPNARRGPHPLTLPIRIERDREALYRGAYMLKASERIETSIEEGLSLKQAVARERRFQQAHETARRNRLEAVVKAQRVAMRFGERVDTPSGPRTLVGWYLNPLLNNDPECVAADGHNFYAEEGTVLGFPGGVHMNCGCIAGPPIEGAGMVDAAVRGVVPITSIPSRPKFTKKRKARMSA